MIWFIPLRSTSLGNKLSPVHPLPCSLGPLKSNVVVTTGQECQRPAAPKRRPLGFVLLSGLHVQAERDCTVACSVCGRACLWSARRYGRRSYDIANRGAESRAGGGRAAPQPPAHRSLHLKSNVERSVSVRRRTVMSSSARPTLYWPRAASESPVRGGSPAANSTWGGAGPPTPTSFFMHDSSYFFGAPGAFSSPTSSANDFLQRSRSENAAYRNASEDEDDDDHPQADIEHALRIDSLLEPVESKCTDPSDQVYMGSTLLKYARFLFLMFAFLSVQLHGLDESPLLLI